MLPPFFWGGGLWIIKPSILYVNVFSSQSSQAPKNLNFIRFPCLLSTTQFSKQFHIESYDWEFSKTQLISLVFSFLCTVLCCFFLLCCLLCICFFPLCFPFLSMGFQPASCLSLPDASGLVMKAQQVSCDRKVAVVLPAKTDGHQHTIHWTRVMTYYSVLNEPQWSYPWVSPW